MIISIIKSYFSDSISSMTILSDTILDTETKEIIIEFLRDTSVHSILNITFEEVSISVWNVIVTNANAKVIKQVLYQEMKDGMCKCFTIVYRDLMIEL